MLPITRNLPSRRASADVLCDMTSGQASMSEWSAMFWQRRCWLLTAMLVHTSSVSNAMPVSVWRRSFSACPLPVSSFLHRVQQDFGSTSLTSLRVCWCDAEPMQWVAQLPGTAELLLGCWAASRWAKADLWRRMNCSSRLNCEQRPKVLVKSSRKLCSRDAISSYCCRSTFASVVAWRPENTKQRMHRFLKEQKSMSMEREHCSNQTNLLN